MEFHTIYVEAAGVRTPAAFMWDKGSTDKFSHPSSHICAVLSSSTNPRRSTATPVVCLLDRYSASVQIWATSFYQRFLKKNAAEHFQQRFCIVISSRFP
ncbi:hypothetical protein SELSPUOL_00573 [Selenomonas sputigena ATCC 35185]|uniref:Uncharacterized protein n=1 Tax=Selenomonas sputigena (strain ATCC 35185 / DSM 20758 / CCUG 44933 / VPI D19B-28) TaxID=546271 RepID=C9LSZ3_SELS3|nr:hypothetical protein SELSPUOL_00573 [Selenomonas sputigena ATCC 35185]